MPKKLQVFVSSTYIDMKEERQAAVEAILQAGHIPAGMELFTAGDKSQWEVIKRWIKESDVLMLILGTRYGSIDPVSKKSYIEMEYDFAAGLDKPHFAVVMSKTCRDEKIKKGGANAVDDTAKCGAFRDRVESKMVKHFDNLDQLKLGIIMALKELAEDPRATGWVPAPTALGAEAVQEIARLSRENNELRKQADARAFADEPEIDALVKEMEEVVSVANPQLSLYQAFMRLPTLLQRASAGVVWISGQLGIEYKLIELEMQQLYAFDVVQHGDSSNVWKLSPRGHAVVRKISRDKVREVNRKRVAGTLPSGSVSTTGEKR